MNRDYVDIQLPYESADNYYIEREKSKVDQFIFLENDWKENLFKPTTFYILGSKGSGKTLLAAYMCAEKRENTVSKAYTIDVGDYGKLIKMKKSNHLEFTDYMTMWMVILLQKFLFGIGGKEIKRWDRKKSYDELQKAISEHFGYDVTDDLFDPVTFMDSYKTQGEVTNLLREEMSAGVEVKSTIQGAAKQENGFEEKEQLATDKKTERKSAVYTDTWIRSIDEFKKTIDNIAFNCNHFLFVDGLDVRPSDIDANEYSECISGLIRAIHNLNTKVFGSLRRKDKHDFRIIGLTRTDIFLNSGLINVTSCINDNCIELDWTYSNEGEFRNSSLYRMMNRVLGWKEGTMPYPVDRYFNFMIKSLSRSPIKAAIYIQRQSRLRPRDIVVMLNLIQIECRKYGLSNPDESVLTSPGFISAYSKYYVDQIRSEMRFKYTDAEINIIFRLIRTINKDVFTEKRFKRLYEEFVQLNPKFKDVFTDYKSILDSLYSLDIIGWREKNGGRLKVHWHYREVKASGEEYQLPWETIWMAEDVSFIIHRGASKNLLGVSSQMKYNQR